ncbi:MAG: hypothetical protein KZQ83_12405 [gamma proteobacterium symbiont of Taylorina sp.]|nr:hypothetical protein [gamma proteobacterium symbiont of Taylorina sp.]
MNTRGLSLDTIPPLLIPLRFFLTAPLFGICAALLIFYQGSDIWLSRWSFSSLALTHLVTLGFMLMVMIGGLYQFIPVMVGQLIPAGQYLAPVIHSLLVIGTFSLAAAFLSHFIFLYVLALISLALSLSLFAFSLIPLLIAQLNKHLLVYLLRILLVVLAITIAFGLYMLFSYSFPDSLINYRLYTDIHALWGLLGWTVLLIMAVSSQVIPMFYVTPEFSKNSLKLLSMAIVLTLIMLSFSLLLIKDKLFSGIFFELLLSIELLVFSLYSLWLIEHRKRKLADVTISFFRIAHFSLLVVIILWWFYAQVISAEEELLKTQMEFILAISLVYGLALSAIIGLLQKIVPFLIFLHLQRLSLKHPGTISLVPNMKKIISTKNSKIQFLFHCLSLFLLIFSVFFPQWVWLAAILMMINFIWLWKNLLQGIFLYQKNRKQILNYNYSYET